MSAKPTEREVEQPIQDRYPEEWYEDVGYYLARLRADDDGMRVRE